MTLSDPIADLLTRIRNALKAKHRFVDLPLSKMNRSIVAILQSHGYIEQILEDAEKRKFRVYLRYTRGTRDPVLQGLRRVSRPGQRQYVPSKQVPNVLSGLGIAILTTPKGVLAGDQAKAENVGGEVLCYAW